MAVRLQMFEGDWRKRVSNRTKVRRHRFQSVTSQKRCIDCGQKADPPKWRMVTETDPAKKGPRCARCDRAYGTGQLGAAAGGCTLPATGADDPPRGEWKPSGSGAA